MQFEPPDTPERLLTYIEVIEKFDITPENYHSILKPGVREVIQKAKIGALGDAIMSAKVEEGLRHWMRQELFTHAAILRSRNPELTPLPSMSNNPVADVSISLRQWCAENRNRSRISPSKNAKSHRTESEMNTVFDKDRAVFINYAHQDNESPDPKRQWLNRFLQMLKPLVNQNQLSHWSDRDIKIGQNWHERIQCQLNTAKAAVLLVSPAFLASEYIRNNELPILLKNAADRGVVMMPIIISPCLFEKAKFKYPNPQDGPHEMALASIMAANPPSRTLIEMSEGDQDRVLLKVANDLHDLLVK